MSKYIDLAERIHGQTRYKTVKPALILIRSVLEWLDEHPDQVPGRTIMESEFREAWNSRLSFRAVATERFGITVVPDPEPTNAEKLAELIRETGYDIRHNGKLSGSNALALDLDARGVKAPGGETDD